MFFEYKYVPHLFTNIYCVNILRLPLKELAGSRWATYFYTRNIEASPIVYIQSEVINAFFTIKSCARKLIRQI